MMGLCMVFWCFVSLFRCLVMPDRSYPSNLPNVRKRGGFKTQIDNAGQRIGDFIDKSLTGTLSRRVASNLFAF